MNKIKVGCDIVSMARFKRVLRRTPSMRRRIFLSQELKNNSLESLAGIFAAKEAIIKALGFSPGSWQEIEIIHNKTGKPNFRLSNNLEKNILTQDLSISHDGGYAIAFVCCIEKD